jgi:hypothetical protein
MRRCARMLRNLMPLLFCALLAILPGTAFAFSDEDRSQTRAVIENQIDAFRKDDGAAAFAFASPALQEIFRDPDHFMAMVRNGYQPVYRPKSYAFGKITESDSGLTASLSIEDQEGHAWTAIYTLEKQPDGSWRITSCRLIEAGLST